MTTKKMSASEARRIVYRVLHCITGKLPTHRESVMAFIESSYALNKSEQDAVREQVEQTCPIKAI